jgi:hypothetical protein
LQLLLNKYLAVNFTVNFVPKVGRVLRISCALYFALTLLTIACEALLFVREQATTLQLGLLIAVHFAISGCTLVLFWLNLKVIERTCGSSKAFHDFLIEFRQTPRSKMLRRHMPKLDAVVEENSIFE